MMGAFSAGEGQPLWKVHWSPAGPNHRRRKPEEVADRGPASSRRSDESPADQPTGSTTPAVMFTHGDERITPGSTAVGRALKPAGPKNNRPSARRPVRALFAAAASCSGRHDPAGQLTTDGGGASSTASPLGLRREDLQPPAGVLVEPRLATHRLPALRRHPRRPLHRRRSDPNAAEGRTRFVPEGGRPEPHRQAGGRLGRGRRARLRRPVELLARRFAHHPRRLAAGQLARVCLPPEPHSDLARLLHHAGRRRAADTPVPRDDQGLGR